MAEAACDVCGAPFDPTTDYQGRPLVNKPRRRQRCSIACRDAARLQYVRDWNAAGRPLRPQVKS